MRVSAFLLFSYFVILLPNRVLGLTIEVDVENGVAGTPPSFVHDTTSSTPLSIPVTLHNESLTIETVALWQLSLKIAKRNDAHGDVEIIGFDIPDLPFLNPFGPGTIPLNSLPNSEAIFFDADTLAPPSPPGKDILPGETRSLVNIELSSSNNATGIFYLVLGGFDPLEGSFWSGLLPPPSSLSNTLGQTLPGEIVLAEIVYAVPEPSTLGLVVVSFTVLALQARKKFELESTA